MKYKTSLPIVPALVIVIFLLLFLYSLQSNPSFSFDSLAYPGPPTETPPQAYPGPEGFTLPSPTPTTLFAESYLEKPPTRDVTLTATLQGGFLLTSTFTPWPTPSPNLTLAGTPYPTTTGTPGTPVPRQGVPSSVYDTLLHNNRYILGDWTFVWGPTLWPSPNLEQIPMIAHGIHGGLPALATVASLDSNTVAHEYWLVYNECEHQSQCDASPEEAAAFFHDEIIRTMTEWGGDPNAQLIIGGVNAHDCGRQQWLGRFVKSYEDRYGSLPHAGWHFHVYPDVAPASDCDSNWVYKLNLFLTPTPTGTPQAALWPHWQSQAENLLGFVWAYGNPDDEVWITETGCLRWTWNQTNLACETPGSMYLYMASITEWLNDEGRWINRYAWYTDWDTGNWQQTKLWDATRTPIPIAGTSTPTASPTRVLHLAPPGQYYIQVTPAPPIALPWPTNFLYLPVMSRD